MKNSKLWSGLTSIFAVILVIALIGNTLATANASYINSALGINTARVVEKGTAPADTTYYKSQFGAFDDPEAQAKAIAAALKQNVNEMREGAALLKNDGALPLTDAKKITVLGHAAVDPAYQASSAGTKVKTGAINAIDLKTALEAQGFEVNETVWNGLLAGTAARGELRQGWGGMTVAVTGSAAGSEENKAFYEQYADSFADYSDAAIVVFAREGAEGTDLNMQDKDDEGGSTDPISSLALHKNERDLLELARANFGKVIVLLNSPNQMEVHEIKEYADAILFIGFPGHQGFTGVAEILRGTVNPSGKLVDTYATSSLSAPAVVNSGTDTPLFLNVDEINEKIGADERAEYISFQAESIYIGYRYYETRYADAVMGKGNAADKAGALPGAASWNYADEVQYPFGWGLSYTTFAYSDFSVRESAAGNYDVTVTVTNTGDVPGKHAAEIYLQKPYTAYDVENGVEKAAVELAGFAKTGILAPVASETLTVQVEKSLFASYDRINAATWILDAGSYYLAIGTDAHDALNNILAAKGVSGMTAYDGTEASGNADLAAVALKQEALDAAAFSVSAETGYAVTNQLDSCDMNLYDGAGTNSVTYVTRSDWEGTFPTRAVSFEMNKYLREDLQNITPADFARKSYRTVRHMPALSAEGLMNIAQLRGAAITDPQWDELMDQVSFEEMNTMMTTAICQTAGIASVGKPETKDSDGPAYVKETNLAQKGQDTGCRLPSEGILAGTLNPELIQRVGEAFGVDAQLSGVNGMYAPGMNIQRTPFGGRNSEYFSEDPVLSGMTAVYEVRGLQSKGIVAYVKHFAFNEQDTNRDGAGVWFNEQAAREIFLRPFEWAVNPSKGNAHAVMSAFIRIGATWCSAHEGLITELLRNEWGFDGYVITDYAGGGLQYMTPLDGVMAGTDCWLLNGEMSFGAYRDNPTVVSAMREATKRILYVTTNYSDIMNGMDASARVIPVTPWWQAVIYSADIVCAALLLGALILLILSRKKKAP